ncbi:MAG: hypothetical protein CSA96_08900, partial [Bacteroidetes bacterium]
MQKGLILVFLTMSLMTVKAQQGFRSEASFNRRLDRVSSLRPNAELERAKRFADSLGIPVRFEGPDGRVAAIRRISPNGQPVYIATDNAISAATISTNKLWPEYGSGISLSGEGMVLGIWDAGAVRDTHQEFEDRVRLVNITGFDGHSTHVGGTMVASGVVPEARGMAPGASLESYDWESDLAEMRIAAAAGLLLSNHSYGTILGFNYNWEEERWEWYGDRSVSEEEDYLFGFYTEEARDYDQLAHDFPYYLIVKSAGNDRGDEPFGSDYYIWGNSGWEVTNEERPKDGGLNGFGCIGPVASAKNILSVGAVNDLEDGYPGPEGVIITPFSTYGPTDDGRVKPDLVANGAGLYSSYDESDEDYSSSSGTSMSSPSACGSLILLQEYYHRLHGNYMRAASLKGLAIHCADDAGRPGPDYAFGWGLMNTFTAARHLSDTTSSGLVEFELQDGSSYDLTLFCRGGEDIKVTLSWTDLAGEVPEAALNPTDRILVNDLDLQIERSIDGKVFMPWVLDPLNPAKNAQRGDNVLDNVEQVLVSSPESGFYRIRVAHKGILAGGSQNATLLISGLADEYFASGTTTLSENNGSFILCSSESYLPDMEAAWLISPASGQAPTLSFSSFETEEDADILEVYDGPDSSAPLLATLSGDQSGNSVVLSASGNALYVRFSSNESVQFGGFTANWCSQPPEGDFRIEGETFPCVGTEESYLVSGQEGTMYRWQSPSGWALPRDSAAFARLQIGNTSGSVSVETYNHCGEGASFGLMLNPVQVVPALSSYSGDTVLCAGTMGRIRVDSIPGAAYAWKLPEDWLGQSVAPFIDFIPGVNSGQLRVQSSNACGLGDTLNIAIEVRTVPDPVAIVPIEALVCKFTTARFTFDPRENEWYRWSAGPGWTILGGEDADTAAIEVGGFSNYIYLEANNECGAELSDHFVMARSLPDEPRLS